MKHRPGTLRRTDFKSFYQLLKSGMITDDEGNIMPENIVYEAQNHDFLLKYMCQIPAEALEGTNLHKAKQLIRCLGLEDDMPAFCFYAKSKKYVPFSSVYSSSTEYKEIKAMKYLKAALKFVEPEKIKELLFELNEKPVLK